MIDVVLMGDERVAAVPVVECGEELVDGSTVAGLLWAADDDDPAGAYRYLRASLLDRLLSARSRLPSGYRLQLVEGYRPYELQELYFDRHRADLVAADPGLGPEASLLAASRFVSPPGVAPHVSGAAVDLTLVDDDGGPLDLGTPIDTSPDECDGACYFAATNISAQARHHRDVLASALLSAGLVNYPTEWWHWSYGDRYWALVTGAPAALYGPVSGLPVGSIRADT